MENSIVECVVNFSVGKNYTILEEIKNSIENSKESKVAHIHSHIGPNRSVFSIFSTKNSIVNSLFNGIKTASKLIDMNEYRGIHPAIGASDVVPFIPIKNITLRECIDLASILAKKVADELNIPIYLYGFRNSEKEDFFYPAPIRKNGFLGLNDTLKKYKPDYGPLIKHPTAGATLIGARNLMVAYNISLNSKDISIAKNISKRIRTSGYLKNGVRISGSLEACQAIAWFIEDYNCVQISCNLHNIEKTNILETFNEVYRLAKEYKVKIKASEIIGLCPKKAFNGKENANILELMQKIALDINSFNPEKRIIENLI